MIQYIFFYCEAQYFPLLILFGSMYIRFSGKYVIKFIKRITTNYFPKRC